MIPQIEPWLDEVELNELSRVIKDNWITEGKKTEEFESRFKKLTGAKHAFAVNNGTIGLYMAQKILGIGEGDEVIVPNLTFIASNNSVIMAGAKPVLVDVNKKAFNIDPEKIKEEITDQTKAIMPVHLYGQSADMDAIMKIAKKNNLLVIEDAAQGVGVRFNGKHVGTFGEIGVFSFYGNKTITTGEGGLILTNDDNLAKEVFMYKNHGRAVKGTFVHEKLGYNFSFTDLQAAVGIAQLSKLKEIIERKRKIREKYAELLKDIPEIQFTFIDQRCEPVHWFTSILIDNPQKLSNYLKKEGIETRRFFYPIHRQPCYNFKGDFPNSDYAYERGLSLPSSALLNEEQIDFICEKIKAFFN